MKKLRTLFLLGLLTLCTVLFFACNDDPTPTPDGGTTDGGTTDGGTTDGGGTTDNGGDTAPDAPSSLNEYGDNVVDYDSLFGGAENE